MSARVQTEFRKDSDDNTGTGVWLKSVSSAEAEKIGQRIDTVEIQGTPHYSMGVSEVAVKEIGTIELPKETYESAKGTYKSNIGRITDRIKAEQGIVDSRVGTIEADSDIGETFARESDLLTVTGDIEVEKSDSYTDNHLFRKSNLPKVFSDKVSADALADRSFGGLVVAEELDVDNLSENMVTVAKDFNSENPTEKISSEKDFKEIQEKLSGRESEIQALPLLNPDSIRNDEDQDIVEAIFQKEDELQEIVDSEINSQTSFLDIRNAVSVLGEFNRMDERSYASLIDETVKLNEDRIDELSRFENSLAKLDDKLLNDLVHLSSPEAVVEASKNIDAGISKKKEQEYTKVFEGLVSNEKDVNTNLEPGIEGSMFYNGFIGFRDIVAEELEERSEKARNLAYLSELTGLNYDLDLEAIAKEAERGEIENSEIGTQIAEIIEGQRGKLFREALKQVKRAPDELQFAESPVVEVSDKGYRVLSSLKSIKPHLMDEKGLSEVNAEYILDHDRTEYFLGAADTIEEEFSSLNRFIGEFRGGSEEYLIEGDFEKDYAVAAGETFEDEEIANEEAYKQNAKLLRRIAHGFTRFNLDDDEKTEELKEVEQELEEVRDQLSASEGRPDENLIKRKIELEEEVNYQQRKSAFENNGIDYVDSPEAEEELGSDYFRQILDENPEEMRTSLSQLAQEDMQDSETAQKLYEEAQNISVGYEGGADIVSISSWDQDIDNLPGPVDSVPCTMPGGSKEEGLIKYMADPETQIIDIEAGEDEGIAIAHRVEHEDDHHLFVHSVESEDNITSSQNYSEAIMEGLDEYADEAGLEGVIYNDSPYNSAPTDFVENLESMFDTRKTGSVEKTGRDINDYLDIEFPKSGLQIT